MMKFMLAIMFFSFMILLNYMISFCYNLMFIMSVLFLFMYYDNGLNNLKISLYFGMDYYSFILILLSFWIIGLMYMTLKNLDFVKKMMFFFLMFILFMFFLMKNMMLFYFFFEFSLIPTFILIVYWGYNPERLMAAYYMLMYTMLISLPLLVYIMLVLNMEGSLNFSLLVLSNLNLSFWGFFLVMGAFLVKLPMFMFHIWLPKAHVEAPVYGSMILAAILLKLGSYGLVRFLMIFLSSSIKYSNFMMSIGLVGSILVSFICLVQIDMKMLVAYSSVVHMNLMMCSLMSLYLMGFLSAYLIMISHGLCSSGLFYMVNLYYYHSSSRLMFLNKGMMNIFPLFTIWWFLLCSSNFSFPLSVSFIGEIYLLSTLINWDYILMFYLILIGFVSSAYSLYLFIYIQQGEILYFKNNWSESFKDQVALYMHYLPLMLVMMNLIIF
nr:NADH dehydrogenase subunit 4 [Brachyponera chinensis]